MRNERHQAKTLTETVPVRFSTEELAYINGLMRAGRWPNRAMLIRSMVRAIMNDDQDWPAE